jgi:transcriptional regulator with XRE-family HTH domain
VISLKNINKRIRDLREFSDYTAADFAKKLNMSESEYIDYESGAKPLTINLLYEIAGVLQIDLGILTGEKEDTFALPVVTARGKASEIERYTGYSFLSLNSGFRNAALEPMIVTVKASVVPELVKHSGEEFNYVIKGQLRVIVGEKEYYLAEGDSIYFDALTPHAQIAMTETAVFLTVIQRI